jgi:hypothetical protein
MNHGFQIIDGANGRKLSSGRAEKSPVYVPLHGGAAVGRTKGNTQPAGCDKGLIQTGALKHFLRHLASIIGDGSHGLPILTLEIIDDGVINGSKNLGVDVGRQQAVLPQCLYPGNSVGQIVKNLRFGAAYGRDGGTRRNDDPSFHKAPVYVKLA